MFVNDWKKDLFTIPNLLSLIRLILIPVYISVYLHASQASDYILATLILGISCMTDILDGQIARHFNMTSEIGKVLDPVADKLTQLSLTLCLSVKYPILRWILLLFLVKEAFQTCAMIVMYRQGKALPGAILPGKVCTAVFFLSLIILVLIPELDSRFINLIAVTDAAFLIYSFTGYYLAYFGKTSKLVDLDNG